MTTKILFFTEDFEETTPEKATYGIRLTLDRGNRVIKSEHFVKKA